jgi:two-component system, NarL family, response regulator DevR
MTVATVLIVDDHEVVRAGLRAVLDGAEGLYVVGEAGTADAAVQEALSLKPDVVLLDVRLGERDDGSGVTACREIRSALPDTRVLMFSSYGESTTVLSALLAGASGYLLKNVGRARLIDALRAISGGESLLDPAVTGPILDALVAVSGGQRQTESPLSSREKEVLKLIAEGSTNKEIAQALVISEHTARNHVVHILDKLGLSRRSEAAAYAAKAGFLDSNT